MGNPVTVKVCRQAKVFDFLFSGGGRRLGGCGGGSVQRLRRIFFTTH